MYVLVVIQYLFQLSMILCIVIGVIGECWRDEKTKFKHKLLVKLGQTDNEQVQKQKSRSR